MNGRGRKGKSNIVIVHTEWTNRSIWEIEKVDVEVYTGAVVAGHAGDLTLYRLVDLEDGLEGGFDGIVLGDGCIVRVLSEDLQNKEREAVNDCEQLHLVGVMMDLDAECDKVLWVLKSLMI